MVVKGTTGRDDGIGYAESSTAFKRGHAVGWLSCLAIMGPIYIMLMLLAEPRAWVTIVIVVWLGFWWLVPSLAYKPIISLAYWIHPDDGQDDEATW